MALWTFKSGILCRKIDLCPYKFSLENNRQSLQTGRVGNKFNCISKATLFDFIQRHDVLPAGTPNAPNNVKGDEILLYTKIRFILIPQV